MEIKSSSFNAAVIQKSIIVPTKEPSAEEVKKPTATLQDDVVTLSDSGGGHPTRPVKK